MSRCLSQPNIESSTLVELLRWRGQEQSDRTAYTFLVDGEREAVHVSYGQLDQQARAIGGWLQQQQAEGQRVLLLYPPGLGFVAAFFGCLYAGAVAVPAYPPRPQRGWPRLEAIMADADPAVVLSTAGLLARLEPAWGQHLDRGRRRWQATDELSVAAAGQWQAPELERQRLAFVQYTSGSTGTPKGVMVSHGQVLDHQQVIRQAFEQDEHSIIVSWLPLYHDMGLIGAVLQPLYVGARCVLLSPAAFLQRPVRWLQAISAFGATTSGGPNFAYDLCVRKIRAEQRAGLDLRRWRVAFNGAEPVRGETLERFAEAFAGSGFRWEAFAPCYGLAEATLLVSGGVRRQGPVVQRVEAEALQQNRVVTAGAEAEGGRPLVSCGPVAGGQQLRIVDPETATPCAADQVGEIWVRGASVAAGYWNRPEETEEVFGGRLAGSGDGGYLRTGDLGFVQDGEVYVTGRRKDLIIIRGRNHYPQDIEQTVEQSHEGLRMGSGAAFSVEEGGQERLVVVQEVDVGAGGLDSEEVAAAIRQAVAQEHEVQVQAVVLIAAGSLPKTSSGKRQRQACRAAYLAGSLAVVGYDRLAESEAEDEPAEAPAMSREAVLGLAPEQRAEAVERYLQQQLARVLSVSRAEVERQPVGSQWGLDSLMALEFKNEIEQCLGVEVSVSRLLQGVSLSQLADQIVEQLGERRHRAPVGRRWTAEEPREHPLSYGQQALWFLHQVAPASAAYNISSAVRIRGQVDVAALRRAWQTVVDRHAALRTTFAVRQGRPVQRIEPHQPVDFQDIDASSWSSEQLMERLGQEAHRPFDLEAGPLLRVQLWRRSRQEQVLLLTLHHLVTDFWSLEVLVDELGHLYAAACAGTAAALPPVAAAYTEYVVWQREHLAGPDGQRWEQYWRQQLGGSAPVLQLPTDHRRPPVLSDGGAAQGFKLSRQLTDQLKALARGHGVTVYMLLLGAFQVLLHRYSGQDQIVVGSPTAGRSQARWAQVLGYFVNPVVLRAELSGQPRWAEFLQQVRQTVLDAFEHQDYPFPLLVERLQVARDPSRSPLFQVMFMMHKAHRLDRAGLTPFALGQAGAQMRLGPLELESLALPQQVTPFDLTLVMAEMNGRLAGSLQYKTDLFEAATIRRMAGHFQRLLAGIVADAEQPIGQLPLLTPAERRQVVRRWNETPVDQPQPACIQQLFEAQAQRTPAATAVIFEGQRLSFEELNRQANQLAHYLRQLDVGPEVLVGLCLERSLEMVVAILGVLKAGGAYVPLDPSYPSERLAVMLEDAQPLVVLTQSPLLERLPAHRAGVVCLDSDWQIIAQQPAENPVSQTTPENLAYVIYTSGSTGKPKGVMIRHSSVVSFFTGMDQRVGGDGTDTVLAVTSMSFDISVLELLWSLTRGARVVLLSDPAVVVGAAQPHQVKKDKEPQFSLFYFANADSGSGADKYRLLMEGARFADEHGFEAVWTPERHFHAFGGLYPNPSVTGAAIAALTRRVKIRAGSVVLPLHDPIRVAEEWSLVDNLSGGRVGVSFASGWHADDFAFYPERYADRKELMYRGIETVQKLWRGESIRVLGGGGNEIEVRIYPQPIQPALPVWITAAGTPDTFIRAGQIGARVLTHLLGQSLDDVAHKIKLYRDSLAQHGHDPAQGGVTLMLHAYLDRDQERVRQTVREPFTQYLRTSVGLIANLVKSLNLPLDLQTMSATDMDDLLGYAFDRYFQTSALFGTPQTCRQMIEQVREMGVDEVACLIDFGVEVEAALRGLEPLNELRAPARPPRPREDYSLAAQALRYGATLLQCTPSMMQMLSLNEAVLDALGSVRAVLLGGEALPPALARQVKSRLSGRLINMYGPTETTIWSATHEIEPADVEEGGSVPIGRPIAGTQMYVLDRQLEPLPVGIAGEVYIGGAGVARGYYNRPDLTAERFIPDSLSTEPGGRLYRTGDVARYRADGAMEFLGRVDHQVKIRGYRIEVAEIEAVLEQHPAVRQVVVAAREDTPGEKRLVAYIVARQAPGPGARELRQYLRQKLPEHMTPALFVPLKALPHTANGKVDRKALPAPDGRRPDLTADYVAPRSHLEQTISAVWQQVLNLESVGIDDNFFDLGGHSLLMAQAHSQLREIFKRDLPLIKLLEHPTISSLARYLSQDQSEQPTFQQSQDRAKKHKEGLLRQRQNVIKTRYKTP
jgi:natural product biosynthesis luciferase-like monooxygenase protein